MVEFDEVFERCNSLLLRIVYHICHSQEAAEDIVQECFIKYMEHPGPDKSVEDAKFWLIRVAKNAALNHVKRRENYRKVLKKKIDDGVPSPENPESEVLKNLVRDKVRHAVNTLQESYRIPLILREYGGLSYKEIARILDISEAKVKIRIFRARKNLSNKLGEIYVDLP